VPARRAASKPPDRVTQGQLAKLVGVSQQAISKQPHRLPPRGEDGKYPRDESIAMWNATGGGNGAENGGGRVSASSEYFRARGETETARAQLTNLKLARERGEVFEREQTVAAIFEACRTFRDQHQVLHERVAADLGPGGAEIVRVHTERMLRDLVDIFRRKALIGETEQ
jgi:hypothetical protein